MTDRKTRFYRAAKAFVAQQKEKPEVIGILITGSLAHGTPDPHSDVDIYIIWSAERDFRERGNTRVEGVEIEYFQNPPQQIRTYLRQEFSPHTAHMLAHGELVYESDPVVQELIREAKAVWATPRPVAKAFQIELAKYQLDDLEKDGADCRLKGDTFALYFLQGEYLNVCIDTFCLVHRLHRDKHKRLEAQLHAADPRFPSLLLATQQTHDWTALSEYMAELLGGKRGDEWILRGPLAL